jgi:FAD/FMN-containing dehydrogenase/Fe-S oxidoreductase
MTFPPILVPRAAATVSVPPYDLLCALCASVVNHLDLMQFSVVNAAALRDALAAAIGGEVRFDNLGRALYSTDASVYQIMPLGVVLPRTEADVVATVKLCSQFGVPLTARGGGTSQAGQCIGPGIVLDCSKYLSAILEINTQERWARVQPGCVLDDLNDRVRSLGLQFAPDISTSNRATIGGMIANNSSGTRSLIHGKTIDHVLELKTVLADGTIIDAGPLSQSEVDVRCAQTGLEAACYRGLRRLVKEHGEEIERRYPKILRRVGGYNLDRFVERSGSDPAPSALPPPFNLTDLLVGSEGTLALTLEAKVRLIELPRARALLVILFAELLDALATTPEILKHGPSAIEVIDRYVLDSTRLNREAARLRDFLQGDPGAILIVEFYADDAKDLRTRLDALEADLRRHGRATHYHRASDSLSQARIWTLRKLALGLSMAEKGDAKAISFVEDTAVAPDQLRDYIAEFLAVISRHGTTAGIYAHASVGCLHVRPVIDLKTEAGVRQFEGIAADVAELVLKYGGALSGEHGDGLVRSPFQEKMFGPALYRAFREIKQVFDPGNILNPGKIVDAPPLAANLRYSPAYVTPQVATTFDFTADGGLTRAAELCAGVGECRKRRDGIMCPSYQATRDEQHSTRGRANTLRLALTGQIGQSGLTDPVVREALDLCLECKACKSECPTNVDMARLKAEFLHHYHRQHGLPWRNWIFGNLERLSAWGTRTAPLSSWLVRSRPMRWLNERLFGIDRRRLPPQFARRNLRSRLHQSKWAENAGGPHEVRLFLDTFVNHYEPQLGQMTLRLLDGLGLRVGVGAAGLPDIGGFRLRCCGRPLISNGMLDQAVRHARHNVRVLYPAAARGERIIACEPSCILTIKDDYPALLRGDDRSMAQVVAAACLTFEEFTESVASREPPEDGAAARLPAVPRKIIVHGHCHQRSLVGMEPTLRLLRRITGAEVIDLDAGCCGMAGSFGYEKEHYEVSRLVGEQRLFPAIRAAGPDTVVVAPGFSCRQQIEHFTGRAAMHPVELLFTLLQRPEPVLP